MRSAIMIILFIVLICNAGCVTPVPLSTMGTAGSAPAAFSTEGAGRGESFWLAKYDDVVAAAMRTGEALSLQLEEKMVETNQTSLRFIDDTGDWIELLIKPRTETMTSITFTVGWRGSVAFGRLVARHLIHELTQSESFLEKYNFETIN